MQELGKALFALGVFLAVAGFFLWKLVGKTPLGKLPGDLFVQKQNVTFYFPLTTCILISVVLSLVMWLLRR